MWEGLVMLVLGTAIEIVGKASDTSGAGERAERPINWPAVP